MEKKVIISKIKKMLLRVLTFIIFVVIYLGLLVFIELHKILPFFPILFLFDFSLLIGYPLFLRFVLKKKWFDCTRNECLRLKYILLPWLLLEIVVILYYPNETLLTLQQIAKG